MLYKKQKSILLHKSKQYLLCQEAYFDFRHESNLVSTPPNLLFNLSSLHYLLKINIQTSSSERAVTTASIILRGLLTLETVNLPREPANWTVDKHTSNFQKIFLACKHLMLRVIKLSSLARSVGMFNFGDLWSYQLGGVLLLAAVRLSFLTLFHFFIVVLNMKMLQCYNIINK